MIKIEIKIDGRPVIIPYNIKQGDFINKAIISHVIQNFKESYKEKKIKFIRYLNQEYDAWMLLNENEDLEIKNDLQILVKLKDNNLDKNQILKKKKIIGKIKNLCKKIDQEVSKLDKQKDIKDYRPSKTYNESMKKIDIEKNNEKDEEKKDKEIENDNSFYSNDDDKDYADIIVLTGNPILDRQEDQIDQIEEKELRSMNDFNSITDSIHNYILYDCNKQIKARFLPLTEQNLIMSIYQKPKILHLICKSVYQLEKNKDNNNNLNNKYCVNLLFENENCEVERVNDNDLKKIFNFKYLLKKDKEILKNISLFISTPLSEDVFDMVKTFNFKNILVQHTSLANIEFISQLNEQLYKNIIDLNCSIKISLENAKKDIINVDRMKDKQQSCCCFHIHEDNCTFKMNLSNELYSDNINKEEIFKIPHFYHLRYKCECNDKDFCNHKKKNSCDNYLYSFNSLCKKKKSQYICCCHSLKKMHDLNHIFFCQFSNIKDDEGIFSNYKSNNISFIINQEYVPNYGKMNLFLGRNLIVYNIFDFIKNKTHIIINIYGKQYLEDINKIDLLIDMIKEFLKERIPYLNYDDFQPNINNEDNSNELLIAKKKTSIFKINKFQRFIDKMNSCSSSKSLNLFPAESAPQGLIQQKNTPIFEKIYFKNDKENNISIINDINNCKNKVYFINGYKLKNIDLIKIFEQKELFQSQIILFTENKFEKDSIKNTNNIEISYLSFESLKKNDYEIKLQNQKISSNKYDFDKNIKNKLYESNYIEKENNLEDNLSESSKINKDNNKNFLYYEILFLFNCSNSGHFGMEMQALFPNNLEEIKSIIEAKYIPKSVLIKKEEINYYRYIRNESVFKNYYETRKDLIPYKVKQLILEKLFGFYSFAFHFLLKKTKVKDWKNTDNNIKLELKKNNNKKIIKYKPYDYLTTFSAIQELGMWLPFKKNKNNEKDIILDIHNIYGYFNHLLRNFKDMFKEQNIMLCMKNEEIWKNIQEDIADISITLSTLLKIFLLDEQKLIISFNNIFRKEENNINPASLRFQLFDNMSNEYYRHKKKHLQELEKIEFGFKNIGYVEGELETLFAKCITNYRENGDLKKFNDILKNKIMPKLLELEKNENYKIDNKAKFITLFKSKVKYKYIKYKLKKGKLNNEDILDLKDLLNNFKKINYFYMMKTCFLLSEWYLQKYKNAKINGKEETKEKLEHLVYLNFANSISYLYLINKEMDGRYIDYAKNYIEKKYNININKKEKNKEIEERIKELCKEYIGNTTKKETTFYVY